MWSERVLIILSRVTDADRKLDVTLEFLRRLPIPWTDGVDKLTSDLLALKLRRETELKEQLHLMELKKTVMTYGVTDFNMSDLSFAKRTIYSCVFILCRVAEIDSDAR